MFFPDKSGAMSEALRVLSPGGHLLFSTWGPIEANPVFQAIEKTLTAMFPEEETPFMPTPFAMCESVPIKVLVEGAGFDAVEILEESHSVGPHDPASIAAGFAFGTPLSVYLSSQGYNLDEVHAALTASFATDLGSPAFFGMQALVCHAERWIELPKSMAAVAKISAVLVLTYLNLRYFPGVAGS